LQESDSTYRYNIRSAVRALWSGVFSQADFLHNMFLAFSKELVAAQRNGAAKCGIGPDDLSDDEKKWLEGVIKAELGYAADFAQYIVEHSKKEKYPLQPLMDRVERWISRRLEVENTAMTMACGDQKLLWRRKKTKKSCGDCIWYDGKVYRASTWARYEISPKSHGLACHGIHCGCEFFVTTLPLSKGRPKKMSGA